MKNELNLTRSEVNLLIAACVICSVRYAVIKEKQEAKRYSDLEDKLRKTVYYGDEIANTKIIAQF